jgi:8-oxo-dGTP pyrophosphatase MutT (NUDIX family)
MIERPQSRLRRPANAVKAFTGEIFSVYQWQQTMFDGSLATFEQLTRSDTAVVFPVLDDGRILLTWQEQPGKPPFIGGCGGRIEAGEAPEAAAHREMLEETGYKAERLTLWHAEQPYSKIDWAVYVFIAHGVTQAAAQNLDAGEKITLKPVTFDEFLLLSSHQDFAEKEIVPALFEARLDPNKRAALKALFYPA